MENTNDLSSLPPEHEFIVVTPTEKVTIALLVALASGALAGKSDAEIKMGAMGLRLSAMMPPTEGGMLSPTIGSLESVLDWASKTIEAETTKVHLDA